MCHGPQSPPRIPACLAICVSSFDIAPVAWIHRMSRGVWSVGLRGLESQGGEYQPCDADTCTGL
jgi:hypothetical protein